MIKKAYLVLALLMAACASASPGTQAAPQQVVAVEDLQSIVELEGEIASANTQIGNLETQIAGLNAEVDQLNEQVAQMGTERAQAPQETPVPVISPTATLTPTATATTSDVPPGTFYVIANDKLNLREISGYNGAGFPIMVIAEPRVQYEAGEWILVKIGMIKADGGVFYYEVVAPRGGGLYVRVQDVTPA